MAFSSGSTTLTKEEIIKDIPEDIIASYYLGITEIPCVICSPLRKDNKPSFGLYSPDGKSVRFKDFATGERGSIFNLLSQLWNLPYNKVLDKIVNNLNQFKSKNIKVSDLNNDSALSANGLIKIKEHSKVNVKIREWRPYDVKYWESYGITLDWLKLAEVYPISHKIITKGDKSYTFGADKYAYAYIERKEGNVSIKIYQPFNKYGYKWCTSTDSSVISLWTKVPEYGDKICICSSLKDALCLWSNTGIPSLAIQGEGYLISDTAIKELKRRYKNIYILLDNDTPGLFDGEKLSQQTGFTNLILPKFKEGKDISDLFYSLKDKQLFNSAILPLFSL